MLSPEVESFEVQSPLQQEPVIIHHTDPYYAEKIEEKLLHLEWDVQTDVLSQYFARCLGLTEKEYIRTLPERFPFPNWKPIANGYFPLLVETRLDVEELMGVAGIISTPVVRKKIEDWNPKVFTSPKEPYVTYLKPAKEGEIEKGHRGATIFEGISFALRHSNFLMSGRQYSFPGTRLSEREIPILSSIKTARGMIRIDTVNPSSEVGIKLMAKAS
ncbi:hypothetical protein M1307_03140 [Patescibacteria group bacterium]|nr:hypothetical protein [Patescibacteria group bacterium]